MDYSLTTQFMKKKGTFYYIVNRIKNSDNIHFEAF